MLLPGRNHGCSRAVTDTITWGVVVWPRVYGIRAKSEIKEIHVASCGDDFVIGVRTIPVIGFALRISGRSGGGEILESGMILVNACVENRE